MKKIILLPLILIFLISCGGSPISPSLNKPSKPNRPGVSSPEENGPVYVPENPIPSDRFLKSDLIELIRLFGEIDIPDMTENIPNLAYTSFVNADYSDSDTINIMVYKGDGCPIYQNTGVKNTDPYAVLNILDKKLKYYVNHESIISREIFFEKSTQSVQVATFKIFFKFNDSVDTDITDKGITIKLDLGVLAYEAKYPYIRWHLKGGLK